MTSLFPHPAYAEDQPYAHPILYLHVARATAMSGTFISLLTAPAALLFARYRNATPLTASAFIPRLLTHASRGLVGGAVLGIAATYGRMWGRDDIEWRDRAWRLQENRGEEDTDVVSFEAAGVGAVVAGVAARGGRLGGMGVGRAVVGGAGLGMAGGVGYMVLTFARGRGQT